MARRRSDPGMALGEILLWILFFALLVPAGVTGWAIGHYTGQKTRTVTVSASGTPATTSAATTAAATTQQATTAASTQQTTASTQKTTTASAAPSPAGNAAQAKAVFTKIKHLIEAAGGTMNDIIRVDIYVTDIKQREEVWKARKEFFTGDFPASTLVEVSALATPELLVEIEAIAHIGKGARH